MPRKASQPSRRTFVKTLGAAAFSVPMILNPRSFCADWANEKIRVASIGVGGKGDSDSEACRDLGAEMVAICDVDEGTLNSKLNRQQKDKDGNVTKKSFKDQFPDIKLYKDFRKMLQEMGDSIDAVTVSTPDHVHGIAAGTAMKMGKHVYCQKPLTQTVYEARMLRKLAGEKKVATQMGNQGSAENGLRRAVEVIQAGVIGAPRELHVWSNRPIWPQGIARPEGEDPVPANFDWDLWLGPAKARPFKKDVYHGFKWRGWLDFGTGALGDMACHTVNMPFRALKLGYPTVVECELASRLSTETYPLTSRLRFEFPERDGLPPLKFWWYDGNPDDKNFAPIRPSAALTKEIVQMKGSLPGSGCLIIGDKGRIFSPDDYGTTFYVMLNDDKDKKFRGSDNHEAAKAVPMSIPRAEGPGGSDEKMKIEWFKMIKDGTPSYSNFDIAAYLTEIILLGCIAMRVGEGTRMEWDGPNMKSPNIAEAAQYVKRNSRPGWEL